MGNAAINPFGALFPHQFRRRDQGAGRLSEVVHHEHGFAPDFADNRHGLDFGGIFAAYGNDGVFVYETQNGRLVRKWSIPHISAVTFASGGRQIAAGIGDGLIDILDLP